MVYIKKKIKINQTETGEYTIEEILEKYKPFVKKTAFNFLGYLKNHGDHSLHVELEDLEQLGFLGIVKAYDNYSIEYKIEKPLDDYNEDDPMGFFPYMEKMVIGEIRRFCRDTLKTRRKDYNIHEIKLNSLNEPAPSSKQGEKEVQLIDIIDVGEKDYYEEIENKIYLNNLLSKLSKKDREVMELYFYNGFKQPKISNVLGISQAQVSRIIKKSIKKLRKYVEYQERYEVAMIRNKKKTFDFNELSTFLIDGSKKYITLDEAVKAFCNKIESASEEDVYLSLNKRKASYENIKSLYSSLDKKKTSYESAKSEAKVITLPSSTSQPTGLYENSITSYKEDIKPKTIEEKPINKTINLDVLKEVNIVNLTADVNDIRVEFTPKGINLYNLNLKELSVKDLIRLQENIQKVIEINNTIYK